jgi:hypothetical protein
MTRTSTWAVSLFMVTALLGAALSVTVVGAAPGVAAFEAREPLQENEEDEGVNAFCVDTDLVHPVGNRLATRYEVPYEQVMGWFCNGMGFGQIMLALHTARLTDAQPEYLLNRRAAGEGWGDIWQEAGLIGRGRKVAAGELRGGPPAWAGPPDERDPDAEKPGGGPPPWAGPPDERDPDAEKPGGGPPPWAGPPGQRDPNAEKPGKGPNRP